MDRRHFLNSSLVAGIFGFIPRFNKVEKMDNLSDKSPKVRTRVCEVLNIKYPIIQSGMGNVAGPELAAAVSNAGGLGILSGTMIPPDILRQQINAIKNLTPRPFGVNLLLQQDMFPPADFNISKEEVESIQKKLNSYRRTLGIQESYDSPPKLPPLIAQAFEVILEEKVPVFSVGLGNPSREMVDRCHQQGIKVMVMVCSPEDAVLVAENGSDLLVAQGSEAGGHRSTWIKKESNQMANIGLISLVPKIAELVDIPVIAAGGIVDGQGMFAALSLGAEGVLLGTRFVVAKESMAPESYKRKLLEESSDNTIITDVFTGMYARVLRNSFTEEYFKDGTPVFPPGRQFFATYDIVKAAGQLENPEYYTLYAGQGIDKIKTIIPAGEIVLKLVSEFNQTRKNIRKAFSI